MSTSTPPSLQEQTTLQRKQDLEGEIRNLNAQIDDTLHMGDSMFGQYAHVQVAKEATDRLSELKTKKKELEEDIREKQALLRRSDRDFSDVKETLPETQERQRIRFMEDYTVMFLLLSYVFMVLSAIVYMTILSPTPWPTFFRSIGYSVAGTVLVATFFYVIA